MTLPRIERIDLVGPYGVAVTWRDGGTDTVDLEGVVYGFEPFYPLRDPALFARATVMDWGDGIEWPNGLDYSADSLAYQAAEQRALSAADLAAWRERMGLSNQEAADWLDVSLSTWKNYTSGKTPIPRPVQIAARAALASPGLFQAHYKPRKPGRPAKPL